MHNARNYKHATDTVKIYGQHAVLAALQNNSRKHIKLLLSPTARDRAELNNLQHRVPTEIRPNHELDQLADGGVHQGMVLITSSVFLYSIESIKKILAQPTSCIIILDQITDPQNVGAIVRSALAFNIGAVILTEHESPRETAALAKASSGAIEQVPIIIAKNLVRLIEQLKDDGYWMIGLDGNAERNIKDSSTYPKIAFVLGSESKGIRKLTREHCDLMVKIPTSGKIDSINVSTAAAIAMFAFADKNTA
jgi:23S rRNA (guanosine2251-2'-O)-methyltransferase